MVLAVTATTSAEKRVPNRGGAAAIVLWIDGFPANGDLAQFPVSFDGVVQMGCYLSPVGETGGCQLNVRLPQGLKLGQVVVQLLHDGIPVGAPHTIEVLAAPPLNPRLVSVTDGINLDSALRTESGGVKVTIKEVGVADEVYFSVADRPVEFLQLECKYPITSKYEFAFRISSAVSPGVHPLAIRISGRELERVPLDVISSIPHYPPPP